LVVNDLEKRKSAVINYEKQNNGSFRNLVK
jgi:hypothetical protein